MKGSRTWPVAGSPMGGQEMMTFVEARTHGRSLQGKMRLALALIGNLRATVAALARRLMLSTGWLLAAALKRRNLAAGPCGPYTLRRWHIALGAILGYKLLRTSWAVIKRLLGSVAKHNERRRLRQAMLHAPNYHEWLQAAVALDALTGWKCQSLSQEEARSRRQLKQRAASLAQLRDSGDLLGLTFALRMDYLRQAGSTSASALMAAAGHCPTVPEEVQAYIEEVKACLRHIVACPDMALEDRLAFMRELRHAYGRTGLVLSGGGSFGFWHFGVVRALLEANLLPRVVSGSSAGSIGAALLCTRTDEEVRTLVGDFPNTAGLDFYAHNSPGGLVRHLLSSGYIQDHAWFAARLRKLMGDLTFLDAYQRSGRVLNIAVTAADTQEPSRLLNYLTAPNVLIWSAVAASSAFPFLFAPQDLMARDAGGNLVRFSETGAAQSQRRWCDGSLEEDLPMRGLSQMFNVNLFIASQSNPWLIGAVTLKSMLPPALGRLLESEFKHRCNQLLAVWPKNRLLKMLCQPWEGDITVVLPPTAFPLGKAALNFATDDIWKAMRHGQHAVWAKLPAIEAACAIEFCIDELLAQVAAQTRRRARLERAAAAQRRVRGGLRASLPSWLHMPSLGLPVVDSECSMAGMTPSHSAGSLYRLREEAPSRAGSAAGESRPGTPKAARWQPGSPRAGAGGSEGARHAVAWQAGSSAVAPAAEGSAPGDHSGPAAGQAGGVQPGGVPELCQLGEPPAQLEPGTPTARQADEGVPAAHLPASPLFESPSAAWRDLMLLSSISAAVESGGGQSISGLDDAAT